MVSRSRRRREAIERSKAKAAAPKGPRPRRAAKPRPVSKETMSGTLVRQSGVDVVGVAQISKTTKVGDGLLRFTINPRSLTGTRLGDYAQLWSRWRPVSLSLESATGAGLMTPGAYIVAWSANPSEEVPSGEEAIAHLAALVTQVQRSIGHSSRLRVPCDTTARWLTFTGEDVDVNHGSLLAVCAGSVAIEGSASIVFKLHWTIEFSGPDIPAPLEDLIIEPGPGWENVFTDSVSDWAEGKKLTFKESKGGSVVEWPGVRSRVIYAPTRGTKIFYYSGTSSLECKFFSKLLNSELYSTALVCHTTQENAEQYQKTGDVRYVATYSQAGEYAQPSKPRLKGTYVMAKFLVDRRSASSAGPSSGQRSDECEKCQTLELRLSELEKRMELLAAVSPGQGD